MRSDEDPLVGSSSPWLRNEVPALAYLNRSVTSFDSFGVNAVAPQNDQCNAYYRCELIEDAKTIFVNDQLATVGEAHDVPSAHSVYVVLDRPVDLFPSADLRNFGNAVAHLDARSSLERLLGDCSTVRTIRYIGARMPNHKRALINNR